MTKVESGRRINTVDIILFMTRGLKMIITRGLLISCPDSVRIGMIFHGNSVQVIKVFDERNDLDKLNYIQFSLSRVEEIGCEL